MRVVATTSAGRSVGEVRERMQALTLEHPGVARLVCRPGLWATAVAVAVTTGALAGALVALIALCVIVGAAWAALRSRRVRGWLERSARREAQRARRDDREARLQEAGVRIQGLAAATALVDQITAIDPTLATYLELDALLDRYVVLELATARCACLLAERYGAAPGAEGAVTPSRIRVWSAALRQACEVRLEALQIERASIVEFFRLLLQRSALERIEEGIELDADPIGERIALLDHGNMDTGSGMFPEGRRTPMSLRRA